MRNDVEILQDRISDFIERAARNLVDDKDAVKVGISQGEQTVIFELHVAERDLGKVIGKEGKNANAIRTIINAMATREGQRVVLEVIEKGHA